MPSGSPLEGEWQTHSLKVALWATPKVFVGRLRLSEVFELPTVTSSHQGDVGGVATSWARGNGQAMYPRGVISCEERLSQGGTPKVRISAISRQGTTLRAPCQKERLVRHRRMA